MMSMMGNEIYWDLNLNLNLLGVELSLIKNKF